MESVGRLVSTSSCVCGANKRVRSLPPLPPGVSVYQEAYQILSQRLLDPRLMADEYSTITERDRTISHACSDSSSRENSSRNRYTNVIPYDYNRVRLQAPSSSSSSND